MPVRSKYLPKVQNKIIAALMHESYTAATLNALRRLLEQKGVFRFPCYPNGLFPAAAGMPDDVSGYQYVWVRDNVHIAHAHYACGDKTTAGRTLSTLMRYFQKHRHRFHDIITDKGKGLAADPMKRPHIRFDGSKLAEIRQTWSHAQNDALGYFLWCYSKLALDDIVPCGSKELECLAAFPRYFEAIHYWRDRDSGHWEEMRKINASSIGTVIAGLHEFANLLDRKQLWSHPRIAECMLTRERLKTFQTRGLQALSKILPYESIAPKSCYRRYDSALLFLIYPLDVIPWNRVWVILRDVKTRLQGDYGIRRYPGDSYWFPDYKKKFLAQERTSDHSGGLAKRDAGLLPGKEAQWCIFDPIISVIYGRRYLIKKQEKAVGKARESLRLQTLYFNRSVGQLTGKFSGMPEFRVPEAYYVKNGRYVPNDHTPLLWAQANLWLAVNQMQKSIDSETGSRS